MAAVTVAMAPSIVLAQTMDTGPDESPPQRRPTVSAEVTGDVTVGSTLTISVDATMPGGWQGLHLIEIDARSGNEELQHVRYDVEDNQLRLGALPIAVGTGAVAESEYLRISGSDVVVTTGGANLSFSVNATVVRSFPEDVRFIATVTTDDDATASAEAERTEAGVVEGLSWGTVAAVIVLALLAGGIVGNLAASRRRQPPAVSVYGAVARRIEDERSSAPRRR
jgi:hypothetical protein